MKMEMIEVCMKVTVGGSDPFFLVKSIPKLLLQAGSEIHFLVGGEILNDWIVRKLVFYAPSNHLFLELDLDLSDIKYTEDEYDLLEQNMIKEGWSQDWPMSDPKNTTTKG